MDKKELFDYIEKKKNIFLALEGLKSKYEKKTSYYFVYLTHCLNHYSENKVQELNELCNDEKYNKLVMHYLSNGAEERHVIIDLQNKADKIWCNLCRFMLKEYNRMQTTKDPVHQTYKDLVCQDIEMLLDSGDIEVYTPYEEGAMVENYRLRDKKNKKTIGFAENVLER